MSIAVVTTFPSNSWDLYSKKMLKSFVKFWPDTVPLCVQLDDDVLTDEVLKRLRPQDGLAVGWLKDHADFVERNKGKDDPADYRKQPVRFCHKVFAIKRAMDAAMKGEDKPRYLIWMDADVITTRPVSLNDLNLCLPKEGDAVAYLGRADWPHSECGWLAFDLENGGDTVVDAMIKAYISDAVLYATQQDDSWIFDTVTPDTKKTNLTPTAKGLDAWSASPMAAWSQHFKGPEAKQQLLGSTEQQQQRVIINTQNAIPDAEIRAHIEENQTLIQNWLHPCKAHKEEIVVVSAGPLMIPEDVREYAKGKKIVAVKHAIEPLQKAGVKIWASILLDPRPHVLDFVQQPDPSIIWFVASQVDPVVTKQLLGAGCKVWGYHASVNAGEGELIRKQPQAIISGGSATATRGLYVLDHLGFSNFALFGYDLCIPDKPDMRTRDERGQPKYMEMSVGFNDNNLGAKRCFWTEPQLIAQFEELNEIIKMEKFRISAHGDGMIPFVVRSKKLAELRNREKIAKISGGKTFTYQELLWDCSTNWRKWLPKTLRKRIKASNSSRN